MNKIRLLTPIILAVLASCGTKESAENTQATSIDFTYEIDTVVVDAGDEFLYLNWDLSISDVSSDKKYLYNLNPESLRMEIVDLDNLSLKETIQFEKEGPNGIGGNYYLGLQVLDNGNICLLGMEKINIIATSGLLLNSIDFVQKDLKGYELKDDEKISYRGVFTPDGKKYAAVLENKDFFKPARGMVIIDMETDSINYIPLDLFARLKEFEIVLQMGNAPGIATGERAYFSFIEDNLIISSSAYNEVYHYNIDTDSLAHYSFEASLTDNEKVPNYPNQVSSNKEWDDAEKAKKEQVSFNEFFKITEHNIFWRFSTKLDRMIGDSATYDIVLTIFDQNLTQLHEEKVDYSEMGSLTFFKDGSLYSYINLEDELGFVRIKPTYE